MRVTGGAASLLPFVGLLASLRFGRVLCDDNVTACEITVGQAIKCVYSSGISDWPDDVPAATSVLLIKDTQLPALEKDTLSSLTNLQNLTIQNVKLASIEGSAFQKLTLLLSVDLRHNKLTTINNNTFKGLHYVRHIDLSYNNINGISKGAFTSLINLKELHLESNKLSTLPYKLFRGLNLFTLNIQHNSLTDIQEAFTDCTLNKLYLQNNFIKHIKNSVLAPLASSVTVLDVSNNPLQTVPESISSLSHLHQLFLSNVKIKTVPRDLISSMEKLSHLDISSNMLTAIDEETIAHFYRVKQIDLFDNQWTCDCGILPLHTWLKRTSVADRKCANMTDFIEIANLGCLICILPSHLQGKAVTSMAHLEANCTTVHVKQGISLDERVGIVAAVLIVIIVIIGISVYCIKKRYDQKSSFAMSISQQGLTSHNSTNKVNGEIAGDNGIFTISQTLKRASSIESSI